MNLEHQVCDFWSNSVYAYVNSCKMRLLCVISTVNFRGSACVVLFILALMITHTFVLFLNKYLVYFMSFNTR